MYYFICTNFPDGPFGPREEYLEGYRYNVQVLGRSPGGALADFELRGSETELVVDESHIVGVPVTHPKAREVLGHRVPDAVLQTLFSHTEENCPKGYGTYVNECGEEINPFETADPPAASSEAVSREAAMARAREKHERRKRRKKQARPPGV